MNLEPSAHEILQQSDRAFRIFIICELLLSALLLLAIFLGRHL
jgi:hypothetical protein